MRIQSINTVNTHYNYNRAIGANSKALERIYHPYTLNFKGNFVPKPKSLQFIKASEYLKSQRLTRKNFKDLEIYDLNLSELNGIQDGIKVFAGLNMKEIALIGQTISEAAIKRGCNNICSHCYAGGSPPIKEEGEHINKMSWNDFEALTDGFKELNERLGFSITRNRKNLDPYMTLFHDADGMDLYLTDNEGKEHDFIELSERMRDSFGLKNVFDTAGWNPNNKKAQMRAEKYAQYYSNPENARKIVQFNLSVNPYHLMHTKEVAFEKAGEFERAKKIRNIYTDRMANVLYTFTPLLETGKLHFLARAAANYSLGTEGFQEQDLRKLYDEIFQKLELLYRQEGKDKKLIDDILGQVKMLISYVDTYPSASERLLKIYSREDEVIKNSQKIRRRNIRQIKNAKTVNDVLLDKHGFMHYAGLLDSNGKYYLTDFYTTFPTELSLNFENKDKKTAPIKPYLQENHVIKRSLINSL